MHNEHKTSWEWIIMQQFQLGNNIVMHKFFDARESVCWYNTGTNRATFMLKLNLLQCDLYRLILLIMWSAKLWISKSNSDPPILTMVRLHVLFFIYIQWLFKFILLRYIHKRIIHRKLVHVWVKYFYSVSPIIDSFNLLAITNKLRWILVLINVIEST